MIPASIGPYRIVRLLGEGGMGVVYEARQESLDRRVALKTLHPEYARQQEQVARFFNEAKVLSKLEHPSIVQVSDFGTTSDGTVYLVMEFLRGESLRHRLSAVMERGERLPVAQVLQIAWQVADVLAVAHAMGVVHRDLKPDKITPVEKWLSFFRRPSEKAAEVFVTHWLWSKHPKRRSKQDHQTWISG